MFAMMIIGMVGIIILIILTVYLVLFLGKEDPQFVVKVDITGKRNVDADKLFNLLKQQYSLSTIIYRYNEYLEAHQKLREKKELNENIYIVGIRYRQDGNKEEIKYMFYDIEQLTNLYNQVSRVDIKAERNKMTPALREYIKERDNYTCQCCGKVMTDNVGLQIDHIIPVSKGGKTEPDNLQVLCSVCNLKKSNK
jgi:hypothetical protein